MPRTHIVISTHTARHLRPTILGASLQGLPAASVTVSIDNDDPDIRSVARACSLEFDLPLTLVWRPRPVEARVGQVRNNAVRSLLSRSHPRPIEPDDLIWFLDGDSVAPPGMLARAQTARQSADLIIGGRLCLTETATRHFDEAALRCGDPPARVGEDELRSLRARVRRYAWHQRLKPLGLVKPHKPKVLGANHGISVDLFCRINGYDESFFGAWREDDDLGRRAYLAGARVLVDLISICVYHLWHTPNPQKRHGWSELPTRATAGETARCAEGLDSPREQGPLMAQAMNSGEVTEEWTIEESALRAFLPAVVRPAAGAI